MIRQLLSLIGHLIATQQQVHLGGLHMRLIQCYLKYTSITGKSDPGPNISPSTIKMVTPRSKGPLRPVTKPLIHALEIFTDTSKEAWDTHFGNLTATVTWSMSESTYVAYKIPGTKGGLFGPKRVLRPLFRQNSSHSNRQHHIDCPYNKEGSMRSGPLCVLFTPQPLSAVGVLFSPIMSGWAGGGKKFCLACISETVRCRKLIRGKDIG